MNDDKIEKLGKLKFLVVFQIKVEEIIIKFGSLHQHLLDCIKMGQNDVYMEKLKNIMQFLAHVKRHLLFLSSIFIKKK